MPNLPPPDVPFAPIGPNVKRQEPVPRTMGTDANPFAQPMRIINPIMQNPIDAAENAMMIYGVPGALRGVGKMATKYGPPFIAGALASIPNEAEAGKASYIAKLAGDLFNNMITKPASRKARSPEEYNRLASLNTQLPKGIPRELQIPAENAVLDGANINEVIEAVKKALQYLQKGL
jgi:hypothetical protein